MDKRKRYALLIGVLIIAAFLRFYQFTATPPGLYPDEAMDGNNAAEAASTGRYQVFYVEDNGREGLYANLIGLMFQFFRAPHEPWVVRLPAAVAGVLTVLGLYLLVAELFDAPSGLLAAFLLATSFWHINFSRIGFRAILAPLLLAWSIWLLVKGCKAARANAAWWYAVAAGAVYALGFYTYIAYRVTPLLFLLFIPFYRKGADFWKRVALFAAATFVVAAPIGWYFVKHPSDFFGRTAQIAVTNAGNPAGAFLVNFVKTLGMFNFRGDGNWRHNLAGAPELFWPVGILFVIGIILGIVWLARPYFARRNTGGRERAFGLWLVFGWFILAALPAAASDEGIPHALRSILMLPPALILAALAGIRLYETIKKRWRVQIATAIAAVFLAVVGAYGYYEYFVLWAGNPNVPGAFNQDYVDLGRVLDALPTSTPKYVFVEAGGVLARGIPVPAETTMFITDTFLPQERAAKQIYYVLPQDENKVPVGSLIFYLK